MIARYNTGVMQVTGGAGALSMVSLMDTAVATKGTLALAQKFNVIRMDFEGAVRYTLDGQTPTAAIGLMGIANTSVTVELSSLDKLVIIGAQKINIALGHKIGS